MESTRICSIPDCEKPTKARGMCVMHYKRVLKHGDPDWTRKSTPAASRFWPKVNNSSGCWVWTGGLTAQGYGGFHPVKHETVLAHRFAYEEVVGPIPDGMVLDHTCHNGKSCPPGPCEHRKCCNPAHLEPTSGPDNVNRSHNGNINKTHCPFGHEYTPDNIRYQLKPNTTSRKCLTCERDYPNRRRLALIMQDTEQVKEAA